MTQPYHQTTVPHEGRRVRGFSMTCGHCGVSSGVPVNSFRVGAIDQEDRFIRKKFEDKGWKIGKSPSQNRCPGCFGAILNAARKKKEGSEVSQTVVQLPTSALREMTREDKRIVFEKINENYLSEKDGYAPGWTDAKIAIDLGIPRSWVKDIREEMFGPEGSNEDIRKILTEARDCLAEIKKQGGIVEPIVVVLRTLLTRADKIEKTVLEIERGLR